MRRTAARTGSRWPRRSFRITRSFWSLRVRKGAETDRAMATELQLVELDGSEAQRWDALIAKYPGWSLFHQRAWLDYLASSRGVALRRGPFRILGSPLRGWSSNFMGPVMNGAVDPAEFLAALDRLARAEG